MASCNITHITTHILNVITWCQCLLNEVGIWETSFGPGNTNNVMALNVSEAAQLALEFLGINSPKIKYFGKYLLIPLNPWDILIFILGNEKPQISPLISKISCGFWKSKGDSRCRFSGWFCSGSSSWSHWKVFICCCLLVPCCLLLLLQEPGPANSAHWLLELRFPVVFMEKNWRSRMSLHFSCKTGMRSGQINCVAAPLSLVGLHEG